MSSMWGHSDYLRPLVGSPAWPSYPDVCVFCFSFSNVQWDYNDYRICSSNLSEFSESPTLNNFGPNLTLIFIPGAMGCPERTRASEVSTKQFSVEVTQDEASQPSSPNPEQGGNLFDCGKSVISLADLYSLSPHPTSGPAWRLSDQLRRRCSAVPDWGRQQTMFMAFLRKIIHSQDLSQWHYFCWLGLRELEETSQVQHLVSASLLWWVEQGRLLQGGTSRPRVKNWVRQEADPVLRTYRAKVWEIWFWEREGSMVGCLQ